jgi:hypothetical protein
MLLQGSYLGEKVVSENEYLSAMATCDSTLLRSVESQVMQWGQ